MGYPLQYSWASLVAQLVRNPTAMWVTWYDPWVEKIPWRMERLPTPVFWPREFHELYSSWDHKELDTTERLSLLPQNSEKVGFKSPRKHFFPVSQDFMTRFSHRRRDDKSGVEESSLWGIQVTIHKEAWFCQLYLPQFTETWLRIHIKFYFKKLHIF